MQKALLIFLSFFPAITYGKSIPKIFFEYGIFDKYCQIDDKKPITESMEKELKGKLPKLQEMWRVDGEKKLHATLDIFNRSFERKEETLTLILCPWFPAMSSPLMVRMRDFLKSSASTLKPDFYFIALVYHEMLHRYLDENFDKFLTARTSPLFRKYSKENDGVLVHIHLFAILKSVYLSLKLNNELQKIIEWDSEIPGPVYKRSWEIVNSEGCEKFVAELQTESQK